jgi:hypothetical protein
MFSWFCVGDHAQREALLGLMQSLVLAVVSLLHC